MARPAESHRSTGSPSPKRPSTLTMPAGSNALRRSTTAATAPSSRISRPRAVVERRKSLLPAGIVSVEGRFGEGDPVDLCDSAGRAIARGLVNYDSTELPGLLGRTTHDLARELGPSFEREVVHRDDLVLL